MFVKRLNKKVISTIVIVFSFVTFNLFAESYSASQLIPASMPAAPTGGWPVT